MAMEALRIGVLNLMHDKEATSVVLPGSLNNPACRLS